MALGEVLTPDSAITLLDHLVGEMPPMPKMEYGHFRKMCLMAETIRRRMIRGARS
jgi:hypothetical protein